MGERYLRSQSCHLSASQQKEEHLSRLRTLRRHVSRSLKRGGRLGEVTEECTGEFQFVKFDTINESFIRFSELKNERLESDESDVIDVKNPKTRKGILWQQSGNIFSTWQERFFVLTASSLYSFSKKSSCRSVLGNVKKFVSKVKLSEIIELTLVEKKGQLVIEIVTRKGRLSLRKPEGVRDWFDQILENSEAIKCIHKERILERSTSMLEDTVTSLKSPLGRPFMGCRSLNYAAQAHKQNIYS